MNKTDTTNGSAYNNLVEKRSRLLDDLEKLIPDEETLRDEVKATEQREKFELAEKSLQEIDRAIEQQKKILELRKGQKEMEDSRLVPATPRIVPDPAPGGFSRQEEKDRGRFSLGRALRLAYEGNGFDGIEGELIQEGAEELRALNITPSANSFMIGSAAFENARRGNWNQGPTQKRSLQAGGDGGKFIADIPLDIVESLFDATFVRQMGATLYTNLMANTSIPRIVKGVPPTGKPEVGTADSYTWTVEKIDGRPKRLPVDFVVSRQMFLQVANLEEYIRNHIVPMLSQQMERAFANGTGTNEATGILQTTGIGAVPGGANGGAPTWDHVVDLEVQPELANSTSMNKYYWANPKVTRKFKSTPRVAGTDSRMIMEENDTGNRFLNGFRYNASNAVPSDLTKGSGTDLSAIIFGHFPDYVIFQWSGIEFIVNPYIRTSDGEVVVHAAVYYDGGVQDPSGFAAMQDAITT